MKAEIIKPKKDNGERKSIITPILYLLLGIILAFKSNDAVTIMFYLIGIIIIVYGIKNMVDYNRYKDQVQYKKMSLSVSIISIIVGILFIVLAEALEVSIRYMLGFFLIFLGVTRLLNQISYGSYINVNALFNVILIILGIFSIFVSNVILVVAGYILMANALLLFWEYFKS